MKSMRAWIPVTVLLAACSGSTDPGPRSQGSSSNGSTNPGGVGGGAGAGGSTGNPGGGISFDASTQTVGIGDDACAAEVHAAETLPLDMFIMMDQSGSMDEMVTGGSKWSVVTGALTAFVQSPKSAGLSAGIQYFGLAGGSSSGDAGSTCSNPYYCPGGGGMNYGGAWNSSCNASDYAVADVEIAPLPANGVNIANSIGTHGPSSDTPTQPALQGAIDHASAWAAAHPGHPTIVVLATDGDPNGCNSSVNGVAQIAAQGLAASPSIMTFVIGVGSSLTSLNSIAQSGGSNQAYVVDTGQDVNAQFLDALNKIRGSLVIPCEYKIPAPSDGTSMLDLNRVNVVFTPGSGPNAGQGSAILQVPKRDQCDANSGGWYYDDPQNPAKIELCDATCLQVTQDTGGNVGVSLGCQTVRAPVH